MTERILDFRWLFLPYCLQRLGDGSYIVLNRQYKPLGVGSLDWVKYETAPGRIQFKRALSQAQVTALSHDADPSAQCIYLYDDDGCVPTATASAKAWAAYSARLQRLAGYLVRVGG